MTAKPRTATVADTPATGGTPAWPALDYEVPVHEAWIRVMRDVGAIGKDSVNKDQHFNFRGIDAVLNVLGPVLRAHGVAVLPHDVEVLESERYETRSKTVMHGMVTRHTWRIVGPKGDEMFLRTLGQASDAGDKVASKASSVGYRTAILQALTVPTGDRDPDADAHERVAADAGPDPRQEWWDRILELAAANGSNAAIIANHYREKMGHAIDGPDATAATLEDYLARLKAGYGGKAQETPTPPATDPPAGQDSPAGTGTPADPPAPEKAAQGRDPRQALWDEILAAGRARKWDLPTIRSDFRTWSTDLPGGPFDIDSKHATGDVLTRYSHIVREKA